MFKKSALPNLLTMFRAGSIVLVLALYLWHNELTVWLAGLIFIAASVTDYWDGHLARKWQVQSSFGRLLDPVADKLLVASALMLLVFDHRAPFLPSFLIVAREILVSGMREFLAERQVPMPVSSMAKSKTGMQMTAISVLLLAPVVDPLVWQGIQMISPTDVDAYCAMHDWCGLPFINIIGQILLWTAVVLTVMTGWDYCRAAARHVETPR